MNKFNKIYQCFLDLIVHEVVIQKKSDTFFQRKLMDSVHCTVQLIHNRVNIFFPYVRKKSQENRKNVTIFRKNAILLTFLNSVHTYPALNNQRPPRRFSVLQ